MHQEEINVVQTQTVEAALNFLRYIVRIMTRVTIYGIIGHEQG